MLSLEESELNGKDDLGMVTIFSQRNLHGLFCTNLICRHITEISPFSVPPISPIHISKLRSVIIGCVQVTIPAISCQFFRFLRSVSTGAHEEKT